MNDSLDPARAEASLAKAVSSVMADMAFIDAELLPRGSGRPEGAGESRVAIDVLKPVSCRLELRSPAALVERIVEILFADGAGTSRNQGDSILEIMNVIAGSFLADYFGSGVEFKLELPQYVYSSDGAEGEQIAALDFDVEGIPLRATLSSIRYRY
jgi:hypothetical protein